MTLDTQALQLLGQLKAQGARDFSDMRVDEARAFMSAFIELEGESRDVAQVSEHDVPGPDGDPVRVRIYRPHASGTRPVIMYFHGGGFVLGNLDVADKPCRQLADVTGCVVVSVDYRLAPEYKAPAAAEDCYAATAWAAEHAGEFGGDGTRLAVAGDSAGGNLAAVVALMARDLAVPALRMQILIYPIIEIGGNRPSRAECGEGYLLTQRSLNWFDAHYLSAAPDAKNPYVSPIRAKTSAGLPRAIVITAGHDPLRDEGDAYARHLQQANVPVLHLQNPTMIHGFMWLGGVIDHSASVYEQVARYVLEHL